MSLCAESPTQSFHVPCAGSLMSVVRSPAGRTYHCAFEGRNGLHVFDVWDSQEAFDAFGATLMPILGAAGIDPGEPMIAPVHNIITG